MGRGGKEILGIGERIGFRSFLKRKKGQWITHLLAYFFNKEVWRNCIKVFKNLFIKDIIPFISFKRGWQDDFKRYFRHPI